MKAAVFRLGIPHLRFICLVPHGPNRYFFSFVYTMLSLLNHLATLIYIPDSIQAPGPVHLKLCLFLAWVLCVQTARV